MEGVEGNSSRLVGVSCFVENVRIFQGGRGGGGGGGGAGHVLWADGLPVEGAGTVEELEVEGGGSLAVDLWVGSGHCWGLVVVTKRGMRVLIYAPMLMQESATDGMSTRWTRTRKFANTPLNIEEKKAPQSFWSYPNVKARLGGAAMAAH